MSCSTYSRSGSPANIVDVGPAKQRILLAALAVDAGRPVPVEVLIDRIWDDDGPDDARRVLHTYVARVRRILKEAHAGDLTQVILERRSGGYQLVCDPELVDLHRFRRLVGRARGLDRSDPERATLIGEALSLWHGEPLAGLPGGWAARMREGLRQQRLEAVNDWADAELTLGRSTILIQQLPELMVQYPLAESLAARLMRALSVAGRDAEALEIYAQARQRIADELGSEPGIELRTVHEKVLRQGTPSAAREAVASPAAVWSTMDGEQTGPAPVTAYHQLPRDIADFTGREAELITLIEAAMRPHNTAVTLLAIEGMGGIGKTRLAVHAAHQLIAQCRYDDVQLYADLRGFSHDGVPADPMDVLDSFLRLLGVPPDRIPADLESRSAVFRDRLADKQALVLLDNAADQEQITPILPASRTCLVIVTSRRSLALPGAQTLRLDPFTPDEAIALLTNVVGNDRVAAEPEAMREIVTRCGGLPLAVTLAAQKLRVRPAWPISHLAARLAEGTVEFTVGRHGVESVFQLSYDALDPLRRRLFRLLGVHPGPDITTAAAAALAGIQPADAEHALESLLDEHLLEQTVPDRYRLHELLHAYAAGRCASHDTPDERAAAITRLLDWYVEATDAATAGIRAFAVPIPWQRPPSPTPCPRLADKQTAVAWLDAEYPGLVALIRLAAECPWYAHAIQLTHLLQPYFARRGLNKDRITLQQRAEKAARRLGDASALAHTLTDLGEASILIGDSPGATTYLRQALDLHRRLADRRGEATTLAHFGTVCSRLGRHSEALDHYSASLDFYRDLDDVSGQAGLLSSISAEMHLLGRDGEALHLGHQALQLQQRVGERGTAGILLNLAWICGRLERHTDAIEYTRRALELYSPGLGGFGEIVALAHLSFSYARVGRHAEAVTIGHHALALARQLAYPDAEVEALNTLAEAHRLAGDHPAARQRHSDALTIATQTGFADEQSRARQGIALLSDAGARSWVPLAVSNPILNSLASHRECRPSARHANGRCARGVLGRRPSSRGPPGAGPTGVDVSAWSRRGVPTGATIAAWPVTCASLCSAGSGRRSVVARWPMTPGGAAAQRRWSSCWP